jgi:cyclophilin family peptidyl-prolyl cis-trans isomerase
MLRLFSNVRLFYILGTAIMLGSLGIGGLFGASALTGSVTHGGRGPQDYVVQEEQNESGATEEAADSSADAFRARQYSAPPALAIDPTRRYVVALMTAKGDVEIELFAHRAPLTVNNFLFLARDGFYDGIPFHVILPGFSVQAGDPTGTGRGGPGYELPQEAPGPFERGLVGMANGSQFFIALTGGKGFEGYTPFGRVIAGMDVVEQLERGDRIDSVSIREGVHTDAEPASPEAES